MDQCSICVGPYRFPIRIKCGHTFCTQCLRSYCSNRVPGSSVPCPNCRSPFQLPAGGIDALQKSPYPHPPSAAAETISAQKVSTTGSAPTESCDVCQKPAKLTMFCAECGDSLCEPCATYHKMLKATKEHKLVDVNEKGKVYGKAMEEKVKFSNLSLGNSGKLCCPEHDNEEIRFYCYNCMAACCVVCGFAKHRQHNCGDVNEAGDKIRQAMDEYLDTLKGNIFESKDITKQLRDAAGAAANDTMSKELAITAKCDEFRGYINQVEKELLQQVASIKQNQNTEINGKIYKLENHTSDMEKFLENASYSSKNLSNCELAKKAKEFIEKSQALSSKDQEVKASPVNTTTATYNMTQPGNIQTMRQLLGNVSQQGQRRNFASTAPQAAQRRQNRNMGQAVTPGSTGGIRVIPPSN